MNYYIEIMLKANRSTFSRENATVQEESRLCDCCGSLLGYLYQYCLHAEYNKVCRFIKTVGVINYFKV